MKRIFIYFLLIITVLIISIGGIFIYREKLQAESQNVFNEGLNAIKNADSLLAWEKFNQFYEQEPEEQDVIYGLFLSAIDLHYFNEAVDFFQKLSPDLRVKQSLNTYLTMITFAHQLEFQDKVREWIDEAERIFPENEQLNELRAGNFPYIKADRPAVGIIENNQHTDEDISVWHDAWHKYEFKKIIAGLKGKVRQDDFTIDEARILAKTYIVSEDIDSYNNLTELVKRKWQGEEWPDYYGTSVGNMQNGGEAVVIGEYIYFPKYSTYKLSRFPVSMLNLSFEEINKNRPTAELFADIAVSELNFFGDWIYYVDRNGKNISRINVKTKKVEKIVGAFADHMILAGSKLYYRDLSDGKKLKVLSILPLLLEDEKASLTEPEVIDNLPIRSYTMDKEHIYGIYVDNYRVFSYNLTNHEKKDLPLQDVEEIVSNGYNLFFVNNKKGNMLLTSDLDGGRVRPLIESTNVSHLHLFDEKTLYINNWQLQKIDLLSGRIENLNDFSSDHITKIKDRIMVFNENWDWYKHLIFPDDVKTYQIDP